MRRWLVIVFCFAICVSSSLVDAQPRPGYSPTSTHIFPAGARQGTKVAVRVGAECIPPGTEFQLFGTGLRSTKRLTKELKLAGEVGPKREPQTVPITYPREWASSIEVPKTIEVGPVFWRLHCAQGGTTSRPFIIGDLPEHIETESNSRYDKAEDVELPVTLNGQIHGERDVDHFRFKVEAGQSVTCEVLAARLGSKLDAVVSLLDASGRKLNADEFFIGNDPVLVFRSPTTAQYILQISNVTHRGDPSFVYRVNVRAEPFLRAVFPGGGLPGSTLKLTTMAMIGNRQTVYEEFDVALPEDKLDRGTRALLIGEFGRLPISSDRHHAVSVLKSSANDVVEIPSHLYGQFADKDDVDEFQLKVKKGETIRIACEAWPPGSPAYPVVELRSVDGKQLARAASVNGTGNVAELKYTGKADEAIQLRILDLRSGSQGAADFTYRATIEPDLPDFDLFLTSDSLTATQGAISAFSVRVKRQGGLQQPIKLEFVPLPSIESLNESNSLEKKQTETITSALPKGVTFDGEGDTYEVAKGKTNARIKLNVSADTRCASYPMLIVGTCEVDGKVMRRVARCQHLGVDSEGVSVGSPTTDVFHLSVQHKPLFKVECSEHYQYAYRGSVYPYVMEIERLEGFNGPIYMQQGDRQNRDMDGVEIWNATLLPDKSQVVLPIYLPETMAINVQSQTQLYSQAWTQFKDKHGQEQSMLILSNKRNMLRSLPPVVKLRSADRSIKVQPDKSVSCRLILKRTSNFPGPMQLRLLDEKSMAQQGVHVDVVEIRAGQTEIDVRIRLDKKLRIQTPIDLHMRAEGKLDRFTVITETTVKLTSSTK
jgi:hypothetical protein